MESSRGGRSEPTPLGSSVWCCGWAAGGGRLRQLHKWSRIVAFRGKGELAEQYVEFEQSVWGGVFLADEDDLGARGA